MTKEKAFKQSEFIKRGYWQGKFLHFSSLHKKLMVSHYPGPTYEPTKEDLEADDWEEFKMEGDAVV